MRVIEMGFVLVAEDQNQRAHGLVGAPYANREGKIPKSFLLEQRDLDWAPRHAVGERPGQGIDAVYAVTQHLPIFGIDCFPVKGCAPLKVLYISGGLARRASIGRFDPVQERESMT